MPIYQSMQRVRFSNPDCCEKFMLLFGETRNQLKTLPGFLHPQFPVMAETSDSTAVFKDVDAPALAPLATRGD